MISFFKKRYEPIKSPLGNYKDGVFFIHIPKTGGTSISKGIGLKNYTHIKAWEVKASGNNKFLKKSFSFAVVRNPFERFISLYNYAKMDKSYYHDNIVEPENSSYPRHLDYNLLKNSKLDDCVNFLMEDRLKHDSEWNQWKPQFTWVYDKKNKNQLVKKIYRLEDLDTLISDLNNLGFSIKSFPRLNASKKEDYRKLLGNESREALMQYYRKDLELFNYDF